MGSGSQPTCSKRPMHRQALPARMWARTKSGCSAAAWPAYSAAALKWRSIRAAAAQLAGLAATSGARSAAALYACSAPCVQLSNSIQQRIWQRGTSTASQCTEVSPAVLGGCLTGCIDVCMLRLEAPQHTSNTSFPLTWHAWPSGESPHASQSRQRAIDKSICPSPHPS